MIAISEMHSHLYLLNLLTEFIDDTKTLYFIPLLFTMSQIEQSISKLTKG